MALVEDGERTHLLAPSAETLANTPVYPLIHLIRVDVTAHIDTPLTVDQLLAPDSTYTIVRPLTEKYADMRNHAIIFCLLVNRVQFIKDSSQLSISTLSQSRAALCEILAIRVLRGWSERTLPLSTVLLTPWALFQGASEAALEKAREEGEGDLTEHAGNALEMAVIGNAKRFIKSPSCQKVIDGIWSGRVMYMAVNQHAIISDNYKRKPIQMYNPHKAPLLDHYRLKVPRIRAFLEYTNFIILFILYVLALEGSVTGRINWKEGMFIIYALGFTLDKLAAMREHGVRVFAANLWNGFDFIFILIYLAYLVFRMYGLHRGNTWARETGTDILAIGAVMMFPRLAFVTLDNNLMILSLRSMISEFFVLMSIAIFCFLGFLYALWTLGEGRYAWQEIGWWLLEVYFGLDASGFNEAHAFHKALGPLLMITFAMLSNTLLLTVLVAILSNTFAVINADAAAESMFRRAVSTIEGVKADAIFSYQIPFNLIALTGMYPLYFILSPRWFHKVNVFMIRASSFPILLFIAWYERQTYKQDPLLEQFERWSDKWLGGMPRLIFNAAGLESLAGAGRDIDIIFEVEKEIGDYYSGWDDDGAFSEAGENAIEDDHEDMDSEEDQPTVQHNLSQTASPKSSDARSDTVPATPPLNMAPRARRGSMPVGGHFPFPGNELSPRRRRESVIEPSPLARLFLTEQPGGFRRSSRTNSMSYSSQPNISQLAGRFHGRKDSTSVAPPSINLASHPIQAIQEGRAVTFAVPGESTPSTKPESSSNASQLKSKVEDSGPVKSEMELMTRLDAIESRQRRIEELLQKMVNGNDQTRRMSNETFDDM